MIKDIKHKGLKRFFEKGDRSKINPSHERKLRARLQALDTACTVDDLDLPEYRLHRLKGDRKDTWAISVSGNWRLTFEFENGNIYVLDYEDYH